MIQQRELRAAPTDFVVIPADVPDDAVESLSEPDLPEDWRALPARDGTRNRGTAWIASGASLALRVPSVVVPGELNVLLNPRHPDFPRVRIGAPLPFLFDPRLASGPP